MKTGRARSRTRPAGTATGTLAEALTKALAARSLGSGFAGWNAVEKWPEIVGPRIAAHSTAVEYREGTLWVEVAGATWLAELTLLRRSLLDQLKTSMGTTPVHTIRFVPARARADEPLEKGD